MPECMRSSPLIARSFYFMGACILFQRCKVVAHAVYLRDVDGKEPINAAKYLVLAHVPQFVRNQACVVMAMDDEDAVTQCQPSHVGPEHAGVKNHLSQKQLLNRDGQLIHVQKPHEFRVFHPDLMCKCQAWRCQRFPVVGHVVRLGLCPRNGLWHQRLKIHELFIRCFIQLVPRTGIEPVRRLRKRQILSLQCLPISPPGHGRECKPSLSA